MNISSTPSLLILSLLYFILFCSLFRQGFLSVSLHIYGNRCLNFSHPPRFEFPKKTTTKTMSTPSEVQGGEDYKKQIRDNEAKLSAIKAIRQKDLNEEQTALKAFADQQNGGLDNYQQLLVEDNEKLQRKLSEFTKVRFLFFVCNVFRGGPDLFLFWSPTATDCIINIST